MVAGRRGARLKAENTNHELPGFQALTNLDVAQSRQWSADNRLDEGKEEKGQEEKE